jgi:hypothetical protein
MLDRCRWFVVLLLLGAPGAARADRYVLVVGVDTNAQARRTTDTFAGEAQRAGNGFVEHSRGLPGRTWRRQALGAQATRENILAGLRWLARMRPGDTAFVYFAIHGGGNRNGFAVRTWELNGRSGRVMGEELRQALARLAGPSVLCLSSCQSGWVCRHPGTWGKCLVIASCRPEETSYTNAMCPVVIEALQGKADFNRDGVVSAWELWAYCRRHIPRRRKGQHPVLGRNPGVHQVVLTRPRGPSVVQR